MFPERFSNLPAYAFPRLRALLDVHAPGGDVVHMGIGEPKHGFPRWVVDIIAEQADGFGNYPGNEGMPALLEAISAWVARRYAGTLDPGTRLMALDGTHRMNRPGVPSGNWQWRFQWDQLDAGLAQRLARMIQLYGRKPEADAD